MEKKGLYEALILWASGLVLVSVCMLLIALFRFKSVLFEALFFLFTLILLLWDLARYRKVLNSIPIEKNKNLFRSLWGSFFGSKNKADKSV